MGKSTQHSTDLKVCCSVHGIVQSGVKDHLAAELVADDHRKPSGAGCDGTVRIRPDKDQGVDSVVVEVDQNNCPVCTYRWDEPEGECPECGVQVLPACELCGECEAENLTSDSHPEGPNLVVCQGCLADE